MSQFGSQFHGRSDRKVSGSGKIRSKIRDKRRSEIGGYFTETKVAEDGKAIVKKSRIRGGSVKNKLRYAAFANILVKGGKYKKAKITGVVESRDNRNFARLGIITKGSVINTELGKARVLNSPGQDGVINATLVEG
ncbi:30S ribosomal protein S8e [uncultured archaeon]|nr:30S ribosomal protein S8e [uncultured archaeon]